MNRKNEKFKTSIPGGGGVFYDKLNMACAQNVNA